MDVERTHCPRDKADLCATGECNLTTRIEENLSPLGGLSLRSVDTALDLSVGDDVVILESGDVLLGRGCIANKEKDAESAGKYTRYLRLLRAFVSEFFVCGIYFHVVHPERKYLLI